MKRILQIIPQHNNGPCGVEDYANRLAETWRNNHQADVRLLPLFLGGGEGPEDPEAVMSEFRPDQVLIHFEAYGFARSMPVGKTVARLLTVLPVDAAPVVFFHELHVDAKPWQRNFLLSIRQRRAAQALATAAEVIATSNETFFQRLKKWPTRARILLPLPVPSNIGEATGQTNWTDRHNHLVVFGGTAKRAALYKHRDELVNLLRVLDIERVIDIGPQLPKATVFPGDIFFDTRGICKAREIQQYLLESRYAALCLPAQWLAKSGIFAAYAAHGVVPLVFRAGKDGFDGLSSGRQFVSCDALPEESAQYPVIAGLAQEWYQSHRMAIHADTLLL